MEALIKETYTLPSLGKVYDQEINPQITLRSMTMEEEMQRLGHSERQNELMSSIIDKCIVEPKPKISSYDMCLADYNFLFYKLRVVTYGSKCNIQTVCPSCGKINKTTIDIDDFEVKEYSEDLSKYLAFDLPQTKKRVTIKLQTPRDVDNINIKTKEWQKKHPDYSGQPSLLQNLLTLVDTVDGEKLTDAKLEAFLRKLPMMDINYILKCAEKITVGFGLNLDIDIECKDCGLVYTNSFRPNAEFFGPEID